MTPEIFYPIGALILILGLVVAIWMNATRNKRKDAITEAATRAQYRDPERYQETQEQFAEAADHVDESARTTPERKR